VRAPGLLVLLLLGVLLGAPRAHAQLDLVLGAIRYVPNRVFDALDLVRLRARIGPGNALTLRAGEHLELFRGDYRTVFAGLPGPRRSRFPRLPVGMESRFTRDPGALDPLDTPRAWGDPGHGRGECAAGFQFGFLGLELGVDLLQILDFGVGLIGLDPSDDDW
jgi:hypothetical protein